MPNTAKEVKNIGACNINRASNFNKFDRTDKDVLKKDSIGHFRICYPLFTVLAFWDSFIKQ